MDDEWKYRVNETKIRALADTIYESGCPGLCFLGSSLGRVFNRDRECVRELVSLMMTRPEYVAQ